MTVSELLRVAQHLPPEDRELVEKAYLRAAAAHTGQRRLSGEEYVNHPLQVAGILAELHLDAATIIAAILHDTVEDTELTAKELTVEFGPEVAKLVEGVTKLGRISIRSEQQHQAENIRKMLLAMAEDIRVVLIKLADRLHNMRTLEFLPEPKRLKISRETLDIYAPLAHRLGIWQIKWELEDLAFRYLQPDDYKDVVKRINRQRKDRETLVSDLREILAVELEKIEIDADISGRPKHAYSIWQKMDRDLKDFAEIYDLLAMRVLVNSVKDCYGVLGVVHSLWKPMPGRFKDYIAMPKSNGYQSLHTTVISHSGDPIEIQIRTHEMHRFAEYGIAAHWAYKEGGNTSGQSAQAKGGAKFDERFGWLRLLMEWQKEGLDAEQFVDAVKGRHLRGRGLRVHAQGRRPQPARRLDAGRLRLPHPHRGRPPLHRCQGQRADGAARLRPQQRGDRRCPDHPLAPRPLSRLAQLRQERLSAGPDPEMVQGPAAG